MVLKCFLAFQKLFPTFYSKLKSRVFNKVIWKMVERRCTSVCIESLSKMFRYLTGNYLPFCLLCWCWGSSVCRTKTANTMKFVCSLYAFGMQVQIVGEFIVIQTGLLKTFCNVNWGVQLWAAESQHDKPLAILIKKKKSLFLLKPFCNLTFHKRIFFFITC